MPTLIVENVPADVYEQLLQQAAAERRSLPEHTLRILQQCLRDDRRPAPRVLEFTSAEETSAPYDLPRSSRPVTVRAQVRRP
jgi:plasmid stability protein